MASISSASQQNDVQTAVKAALAGEHLSLDVGADNGSEFPENRQSKLTAASQQLALDHVLDQLEQFDPKMVIVVATDVRDRLFLFDQLRHRLPSAMLIDLETDVLLAHPGFPACQPRRGHGGLGESLRPPRKAVWL